MNATIQRVRYATEIKLLPKDSALDVADWVTTKIYWQMYPSMNTAELSA